MESYTWNITDKTLINGIKNAKQGRKFTSPTFRLFNLSFEIEIWPNGSDGTGESDRKGQFEIFLNICPLPSRLHSIDMKRKYTFVEIDKEDVMCCTISREKISQEMYSGSWKHGHVKTTDIQKLKQMTFKVDFTLYNASDKYGNDVTNKYIKQANSYDMNNNKNKRSLSQADININPPNKKRKYSNNNNNSNNIDTLIDEKMKELIELHKQKQKQNNFKDMYEKEQSEKTKLAKEYEKEKMEHNTLKKIHFLINNKCVESEKSNLKITKEFEEFKQDSSKQIETLNEKINVYNGTSNNIRKDRLDLEQLNEFDKELINGMDCISKSRVRLMELKNKCIACRVNNKNMAFLDGCNHISLCMECENKLIQKQCPMCRTQYTNARKMNL